MIHVGILFFYAISLFVFGWVIVNKLFGALPMLLTIVGAWLLGTMIGVPITYLLSCLFVKTGDPMVWGIVGTTVVAVISSLLFVFCVKKYKKHEVRKEGRNIRISDVLLIVFAFSFSAWIMTKTFHGGINGELYVGSNNVFDFSHALGIIRSFAWGQNIPFSSPFQAGLPFFYHFFFYFYVALWEHFGVPIVWAMNIPSVLSMTALLFIIYFLPQIVFQKKPLVGWIAVLLSITNSTLTFWQLLLQKGVSLDTFKSVWLLPTYPFAGPFDGSTISLFTTLNNYVNQRHLAFAIAVGLFLYIAVEKRIAQKHLSVCRSIIFGVLTGLMFYWNIFVAFIIGCLISLGLIVRKQWKNVTGFTIAAIFIVIVSILPYIGLPSMVSWATKLASNGSGETEVIHWTFFQYFWQNLGLLPVFIALGWYVIAKQKRGVAFSVISLFVAECIYAGTGHRGFDQKFFSFLIIGVNVIAAIGIGWIWEQKRIALKPVAIIGLFVLTISGIVDLIPIKNEFAFPLISSTLVPAVTWIQKETSRDAVFISYKDMLDPVVFAGRKNYFGFFGNIGYINRTANIQSICSGDVILAKAQNISYILISKEKQNGKGCTPENLLNNPHMSPVYYDNQIYIFRLFY